MTVPPHRFDKLLKSLKNSSRTIQSHSSCTPIPLTTRRFLALIVLEFSNIEQYSRSFSKVSESDRKHVGVAFSQFFSSYSNPLHPNCSEHTRRLEVLHAPRHSVHSDQVAVSVLIHSLLVVRFV